MTSPDEPAGTSEPANVPEREPEPDARGDDAPPTVPVSPEGEDPAHIPDPMPDDLKRTEQADRAFEESQPMEGEAPTG